MGGKVIVMTDGQTTFFKELEYIQDWCIGVTLAQESRKKYGSLEDLLKDVTSEAICRIMVMLDGYGNKLERCNIVNTVTGEIINANMELHDACVDFLKFPD